MPRSKRSGKVLRSYFNGERTITVRLVILICADCEQPFEFEMTTKEAKRCPGCTDKVFTARRQRDYRAAVKKKQEREGKPVTEPAPPKKKLIPYAGWDGKG